MLRKLAQGYASAKCDGGLQTITPINGSDPTPKGNSVRFPSKTLHVGDIPTQLPSANAMHLKH